MQDYIRNLISFPLGRRERWLEFIERESDEVIYSPDGASRMRLTQVWGGGPNSNDDGFGVFTFDNAVWLDRLNKWFDGTTHAVEGLPNVPNHVTYISGLHDARNSQLLDGRGGWRNDHVPKPTDNLQSINQSNHSPNDRLLHLASNTYRDKVRSILQVFHRLNQLHPNQNTRFIWRTSVAPAGQNSNPKAEGANTYSVRMFNSVVISEMKYYQSMNLSIYRSDNQSIDQPIKPIQWLLDDQYDLSHAWNEEPTGMYSDGGHYGRRPGPHEEGSCDHCVHNPFVEVM